MIEQNTTAPATCWACERPADSEQGPVTEHDDLDGLYHDECAHDLAAFADALDRNGVAHY